MKPSAEQQLQFLQHIQRLFEEGDFVATYKYALLMSLAELVIEADRDEAVLELPMIALAAKFAELYPTRGFWGIRLIAYRGNRETQGLSRTLAREARQFRREDSGGCNGRSQWVRSSGYPPAQAIPPETETPFLEDRQRLATGQGNREARTSTGQGSLLREEALRDFGQDIGGDGQCRSDGRS